MLTFVLRALTALLPLRLALSMAVFSFLGGVALVWSGSDTTLAEFTLVSLLAGATAAITGDDERAMVTFAASGMLSAFDWWAAAIPALVVIDYRIARRVIMLSHVDKTAPRRPGLGFWRTLQAWAGWSRT